MAEREEISLRPLSLRPGGSGSNPFAAFGKGAGFGIKAKPSIISSVIAPVDQPKKAPGQIIKYHKEFLLRFMERYSTCPLDLQQSQLEIVISEESERDVQRQALQRVAEEVDVRDWRTRAPPAAPAAGGPGPRQSEPQQQQQQPQAHQGAINLEASKIQRAADIGRTAYRPGGSVDDEQRALRQVKGILNKLTPEKFERLLEQLLQVVTTAAVLKSTISMVFENAVAQPTFCAMYADLCLRLSKELPSFPPQEGDDKPMSFKRVLLNTCQDEFEGAATARDELASVVDPEQRAPLERQVKLRTMGTVRLIGELYRQEVVKESIITVCVRELLEVRSGGGKGAPTVPPEENLEAACEMITITGKILSASENKKTREMLDGFLARLSRLSDSKELSSRVRFIIRDVLDMRKNKWVPRRETFTAKKLDEVHAEAEAELGMVSSRIAVDLPALPAQTRMTQEDFSLLPPLRGGEDGWEFVGRRTGAGALSGGGGGRSAGGSALVGEYRPPEPLVRPSAAAAAPATAAPAPKAAAAAPAPPTKPSKPLSTEDIEAKAKSLFREFASVGDFNEAALCARELRAAPRAGGAPPGLAAAVAAGLLEAMDQGSEKGAAAVVGALVRLAKEGLVTGEEVVAGLGTHSRQLDDLALDVPKAPQLLGDFFGGAAAAGVTGLGELTGLLSVEEGELVGGEPRRRFCAAAFKAYAAAVGGNDKLGEAARSAGLKAGEVLAAGDFDGDMPSVEDFLKAEGLAGVLPL